MISYIYPYLRRRIIIRINLIFMFISLASMQGNASNYENKNTVNYNPIVKHDEFSALDRTNFIQDFVVTGVVKDTTGGVLPGVSVMVKGSSKVGTTTDGNGRYSLSIPKGSILIFSIKIIKDNEVTL